MVFDLALLQTCDLAHFAWQNQDTQARVLWHTAEVPRRPSSARVFYLLTSNLAQSLQAVRLLLLHGFEGQARSMFRSFVELADFTLAAAAYTNVYRNYVTTFDDSRQEYQH